jgi:hypothetical protein
MGVVRRQGKWKLSKVEDGLYEVKERDQSVVEIITDDYESGGGVLGGGATSNPAMKTIEVSDFSEAEDVFEEYASGERDGGIGFF